MFGFVGQDAASEAHHCRNTNVGGNARERMEKKQYRFKRDYFHIKGIHNIPGLIICSGHGYDLRTYCCKTCGQIFVVDGQLLALKGDLNGIANDKDCPKCGTTLDNHLVKYPENVFYNGATYPNENTIDNLHFEDTELIETYEIKL